MGAKFILSGTYRMGTVGQSTPFIDASNKKLYVGDIVVITSIDEFGINYMHGLSVVVSDEWISYSNGDFSQKETGIEYFVMGIKGVDFMQSKKWAVRKVKSFEDVVPGEKWADYGFNYV